MSRMFERLVGLFRRRQQPQVAQQSAPVAIGSWPTATGVVIESRIQAQRAGSSGSGALMVGYHYLVDGHMYLGYGIRGGQQPASEDPAATVARYPVGANVTVYYNPANPAEAVLER